MALYKNPAKHTATAAVRVNRKRKPGTGGSAGGAGGSASGKDPRALKNVRASERAYARCWYKNPERRALYVQNANAETKRQRQRQQQQQQRGVYGQANARLETDGMEGTQNVST